MSSFIHDDFLLGTKQAVGLYHGYAEEEPIYDYHCHLSPAQIAENHEFANLTDIWLTGDHYKWRAMRANGIPERLITGRASDREKFDAWCTTVPYTLGNPLYHWSHLELKRYFGIDVLIGPETADRIWEEANEKLAAMRVHDILRAKKVAVIGTTDDPADSLDVHRMLLSSSLSTRVYPTYRPDQALGVDQPKNFNAWRARLGDRVKSEIRTFDDLLGALKQRHDDFHAVGARLSDHGLSVALSESCSKKEAAKIFQAACEGRAATAEERVQYGSYLMREFGRWDADASWTKQLHLGVLRNNNTRLFKALGPDTGFDSIGDLEQIRPLQRYLDALDETDQLPRTVLYNLNPADNYAFATVAGNFQDGSVPGKVQFGSGWWFLDQKEGMEWQLSALANLGLLSRFVGMLTDSRSFLSYARHEYFRRVLCGFLGRKMAAGELPDDLPLVGKMVRRICFANARDYFRLALDPRFDSSLGER